MNETFTFFKIAYLALNILTPVSFSLVKEPLKLLFGYDVKLRILKASETLCHMEFCLIYRQC